MECSQSSEIFGNSHLFHIWRKAEADQKTKEIANEILKHYGISDNITHELRVEIDKFAYTTCKSFKRLWEKHNRTESRVLQAVFFKKPFVLPNSIELHLPSTSGGSKGRKKIPFQDSSDCVKRRKTAMLRATHNADELSYAATMKLREEGKRAQASVLQMATQSSPSHVAHLLNTSKNSAKFDIVPYTPDEALALICNAKLTLSQYKELRINAKDRNADLYPSYKKVLEAKKRCYPEDAAITINDTEMDIKLQALLDHTAHRIVLANSDNLINFSDEELKYITLITKYGFDGSSGVSQFKQTFTGDDGTKSDGSIFITSVVPIQAKGHSKTLFKNPRPSSTRYCRPLRIQYTKENTELILAEKAYLDDQISALKPSTVEHMGRTIIINHKLLITMVDGKVCNALTSNKSSQRCYICGATPSQMNDIDAMQHRKADEKTFQFGISPLHAYIRFFEYFLHLSYKIDIEEWQARTSEQKTKVAERKSMIQTKFKIEMGLLVDQPRAGGLGNSNDGNTARRFFKNWETSAEFTGLDVDVLFRCKIILEALSSGCEIDCDKFEVFGLETARMLVALYPWYKMPVTVHKVLIHGSDIISSFLLPIGQLSEEAQEAKNKDVKKFRLDHTRKISRQATNTDLLHRLLETSDPFITSLREQKQKMVLCSNEAKQLLVLTDDIRNSESEDD